MNPLWMYFDAQGRIPISYIVKKIILYLKILNMTKIIDFKFLGSLK